MISIVAKLSIGLSAITAFFFFGGIYFVELLWFAVLSVVSVKRTLQSVRKKKRLVYIQNRKYAMQERQHPRCQNGQLFVSFRVSKKT